MHAMWDIRGRKAYWNHINYTRKSKSDKIPLHPVHVERHFQRLLDAETHGKEGAGLVLDLGIPECFYTKYDLPSMEPPHMSVQQMRDLFIRKEDNILKDIPVDDLLSHPLTSFEISYALAKLKNSSKGEDAVKILKLRTVSSNDISQFFITVMDSGTIPTCWHRLVLVPIPKKKIPTKPSELQGIAIQPALRRLFAACVARRIHAWCEIHNILPPAQSGFRPLYRTTENIFILRCLVEQCMFERSVLVAASVDIEKAFDKVNRKLLWAKLRKWGVVGALLEVVIRMYEGPMVSLKMNARYSDFMPTTNGVLQGCPLSPLLFICYLADIPITSWTDPSLNGMRISGLMRMICYWWRLLPLAWRTNYPYCMDI